MRESLPPSSEPLAPPPAAEVTGLVHRPGPGGHWEWDGGTAVVVAPGETLETIAHRHKVPVEAIMQANNIKGEASIAPGQRLVIPHYTVESTGAKVVAPVLRNAAAPAPIHTANSSPAASPSPAHVASLSPAPAAPTTSHAAPIAAPSAAAAAAGSKGGLPASAPAGAGQTLLPPAPEHTVTKGDTLGGIARKYHVTVKELTVANGLQPNSRLELGMKIAVPVKTVPTPAKVVAAAGAAAGGKPAPILTKFTPEPGKPAIAELQTAAHATAEAPVEEASAATIGGGPTFRWPLRGRVINNFGTKVNGNANDGIDLAVPEGTPVRAAEDGVVAYAGSELKGYGNLVLVRHANGYVTAYANASELLVKRNDQIHRGQVIAKSGQSGTAANPQLHFEIRKNSSPVDPVQFLPADKTASAPL